MLRGDKMGLQNQQIHGPIPKIQGHAPEPFPMSQVQTPITGLTVANGEKLAWGKRTYVMGIINVTPDSFSGDGLNGNTGSALNQALRFQEEGADILDIGAESTHPGYAAVSQEEELQRLMPALEAIANRTDLPISVDTYKAEVARQAVAAGAVIINDVWGLKAEPELARVAADTGAGLVLMHNQRGTEYQDFVPDMITSLEESVALALAAGVLQENIVIDPGFGFGKTPDHNMIVMNELGRLKSMGYPILVGTSRKSTLGLLLDLPADQRVEGTAATVSLAIAGGADIVRVHDVKEMVRVCRVTDSVVRGWRPEGWKTS